MVQEELGITEEMTGVVVGCISNGVWVQHYVHLRLELRRLEYNVCCDLNCTTHKLTIITKTDNNKLTIIKFNQLTQKAVEMKKIMQNSDCCALLHRLLL